MINCEINVNFFGYFLSFCPGNLDDFRKSKFWAKIEILGKKLKFMVKDRNFGQKIKILVKN